MNARTLSPLDRLLSGIERALETVSGAPEAARPSPADAFDEADMDDAERRHILDALDASNWVVGGPSGAASMLGMKRSTLQSRMQKLGIVRRYVCTR